jgi:hypothetical protein
LVKIASIIPALGSMDYGTILFYLFFFIVMPVLYIRMTYWQAIVKLEGISVSLEKMTDDAKKIILKKITKKQDQKTKNQVNDFLEFFAIEPVNLDPYGIIPKVEHIVNLSEKRFKVFAEKVAPQLDAEEQANLVMGLSGAISLNQISKIVRHICELVKKTKNAQLAMIYQMQMPLIERIAKALLTGTEALSNGWPIGDAAGSFFAAHMIENTKTKEIEEDVLLAKRKIKGRNVFILKAKGPGGRLGKLGKAAEKILATQKIKKIITVDAAAKLEGERTGSVAEGVGVAIGGPGVDRSYIENIATKRNIPIDTFIIKMSQEEAIMPIKKEVLNAIPRVMQLVEENIAESEGNVLLIGVGNTGGVGNNKKAAIEAEAQAKKVLEIMKGRKDQQEEKKNKWTDWLGI